MQSRETADGGSEDVPGEGFEVGVGEEVGCIERHLFEPVRHGSVVDVVVDQIERLIVRGVLRGGQKLPAERELADDMGVSRPKIREAIKVLVARELLSVRQGDGTFVAALTGASMSPRLVELFARHPDVFRDYLEFRRELEGFAASAAAQRATAADRDILQRRLDDMQAQHARPDPAREAELDVAFHLSVADASHNAMLVHMMASIYRLMARGVFYNREYLTDSSDSGMRERLLEQHRAIAEAIARQEPAAAAAAAERHLDFVAAQMQDGADREMRVSLAGKRLRLLDARR